MKAFIWKSLLIAIPWPLKVENLCMHAAHSNEVVRRCDQGKQTPKFDPSLTKELGRKTTRVKLARNFYDNFHSWKNGLWTATVGQACLVVTQFFWKSLFLSKTYHLLVTICLVRWVTYLPYPVRSPLWKLEIKTIKFF